MSAVLRYRHPAVCQHLASQYVAGHLSVRVRRRVEALMPQHPPLADAVAQWSDELWHVQSALPTQAPPRHVWRAIQRLTQPALNKPRRTLVDWWNDVTALRWLSVGSSAAALVLAWVLVWQPATSPSTGGPAYMAPLSQGDAITLVVYGYLGDESGPPALRFQWTQTDVPRPEGALHLWAESQDGQEQVYLGELVAGQAWQDLERVQWQALASSRRLLVSAQADQLDLASVFMEGPCVQLRDYSNGQPS
ncbi:MAG: hypothetical protein JXQ97_03690 [Natronospirillum sp.]